MADIPKQELAKAGGPDITRLLEPGEQVVWQGQSSMLVKTNTVAIVLRHVGIGFVIFLLVCTAWISAGNSPFSNI